MFIEIVIIFISLSYILVPVWILSKKKSKNRNLLITGHLLLIVWISRFCVGLFSQMREENGLSGFETVFDSIVHSLQTFSMDEDYTTYTSMGKQLLRDLGYPLISQFYGIAISILNVCAPILGGAILLTIITDAFSGIRVVLSPFRHKYVFSKLNEFTIELAEDIYRDNHYEDLIPKYHNRFFCGKPLLIFTDVYLDDDSESNSELLGRAKALRAVCVKDDLLHFSVRHSRSVDYFLMEENTKNNISKLSELLLNNRNGEKLWPDTVSTKTSSKDKPMDENADPKVRIFVFTHDDFDNMMVNSICSNIPNANCVLVRPIQDFWNMAINLMNDVPLFLPLLKNHEKELHITIFGGGKISTEVVKAIYWCSQMKDIEVYLTVVADDAESLKKTLLVKCPDLIPSCQKDHELLRVYPKAKDSPKNAPYLAGLEFITVGDVFHLSDIPSEILDKTNYYVITLGSDDKNITLAKQLSLLVNRKVLTVPGLKNTVICPAVYNDQLASSIRQDHPVGAEPFVLPFGTLKSRFSCNNIFMTSFTENAAENAEVFDRKTMQKMKKDEYAYWANIARTVHAPYKMFGLGMITSMNLEQSADKDRWTFAKKKELTSEEMDELSWIEHRRWNAFLRAQGFTAPSSREYETYYADNCRQGKYGMHKDIARKFHPCIVESEKHPRPFPVSSDFDGASYDGLDWVAFRCYHAQCLAENREESAEDLRSFEYKQYDYCQRDYDGETIVYDSRLCELYRMAP